MRTLTSAALFAALAALPMLASAHITPCGARAQQSHLLVKGAAIRPGASIPATLSRIRTPQAPSSWRPPAVKRNPLNPLRRRWMA